MDNTEIHYLTYDPDAIWEDMMLNYVEAGGDILYPGDEKDMLLRSVQADIVQVFAGVDNALRMQTLRYAVGPYLDLIGERRNCERITASPATAQVTITAKEAFTLPEGSTMTADGQVFYQTKEDIALTGNQLTATIEVECTEDGITGNGLTVGTALSLSKSDYEKYISSIVSATDAFGGNEEEDDDTYRERIRLHGLIALTSGPKGQYEAMAKAVSSDIVDAEALGHTDMTDIPEGEVWVYLIFASDTGKTAVINSVLEKLSAKDTRPLTDKVSVKEATAIPYAIDVQYACDNSSEIVSAVNDAVSTYQKWQDSVIGRPFNPDLLMASMYQAGCTRVKWGSSSTYNGTNTIAYTEIKPNERCKGTVTLHSMT